LASAFYALPWSARLPLGTARNRPALQSTAAQLQRSAPPAGRRRLRFHDLRHTFGTHAIRIADPREVMEWMGHADLKTTQIYLQYKPKADAARRLSEAFGAAPTETADDAAA
jgi:integrase